MHRGLFMSGAVSAFLAVALGAFGAHALKDQSSAYSLDVFHTGVQYQSMHALALLLVSLAWGVMQQKTLVMWSGRLFLAGTVVFSGSLYLLAITGMKWLGAITPIGGVCFLIGWALLVLAGTRSERIR
jgi:uncharacterized membrane protein YgdD (TMEM256/DUF423 family)